MNSLITRIGVFAIAAGAFGMAVAETDNSPVTSTTQGLVSTKNAAEAPQEKTLDREITAGKGGINTDKPPRASAQALNQNFWIYDVDTTLLDDLDGDGFFTRLELTFDADTVFDGANVYAVLYLSLEGGPWIEYGETNVFEIYGTSGNDSYFYDSDLVSGFAPGYYDVLIELYDDFDNRLVAEFGPADADALFDLPLESIGDDGPVAPIVVVSNEGGGGAGGLWMMFALLALTVGRVLSQRLRIANQLAVKTRRFV